MFGFHTSPSRCLDADSERGARRSSWESFFGCAVVTFPFCDGAVPAWKLGVALIPLLRRCHCLASPVIFSGRILCSILEWLSVTDVWDRDHTSVTMKYCRGITSHLLPFALLRRWKEADLRCWCWLPALRSFSSKHFFYPLIMFWCEYSSLQTSIQTVPCEFMSGSSVGGVADYGAQINSLV